MATYINFLSRAHDVLQVHTNHERFLFCVSVSKSCRRLLRFGLVVIALACPWVPCSGMVLALARRKGRASRKVVPMSEDRRLPSHHFFVVDILLFIC